ncbi:MAG: hypothetical protein AAFP16_10330 [Pseudomonadota bacterium]
MFRISTYRTAGLLAAALAVITTPALAQLSSDQIAQLKQSRGAQVLSSDGALVGTMDGASINGDKARLFLRAARGSLFSRKGKPLVLNTSTDDIRLVNGAWVLSSDELRVKVRANFTQTEDAPITINLPAR